MAEKGMTVLERLRAAGAKPADPPKRRTMLDRLRGDHVEDARDFEARQREEADRLGHARKFTEDDKQAARAAIVNKTDSTGKHVALDERHAAEQDAIAGGKRLRPGDYEIEILRCYSLDGDPEIWLPETGVGYFVCEMEAEELRGWAGSLPDESDLASALVCGAWVNRLRFNGHQQLKVFLIEAYGIAPAQHGLITAAKCGEVVSAANPLRGVRLKLTVQPPTRAGYMHHRWSRLAGGVGSR